MARSHASTTDYNIQEKATTGKWKDWVLEFVVSGSATSSPVQLHCRGWLALAETCHVLPHNFWCVVLCSYAWSGSWPLAWLCLCIFTNESQQPAAWRSPMHGRRCNQISLILFPQIAICTHANAAGCLVKVCSKNCHTTQQSCNLR